MKIGVLLVLLGALTGVVLSAAERASVSDQANSWSPKAAVTYLDYRETWWQNWPVSQRDHKTVCISCHSAVPYALARPSLREDLQESGPSEPEQFLLSGVKKRVALWSEVLPFYTDEHDGPLKSAESRGTEAVLNALVLVSSDAPQGSLQDLTRTAFNEMWKLQLKSGPAAGAWNWLNFHLSPWESNESQYFGAALAAVAVGRAPESYQSDPAIQDSLSLLRGYLTREYDRQPLADKLVVLWASGKLTGILTAARRATLLEEIFNKQLPDGGWTLTTLGTWKRRDNSALPITSDGYATGLTVYALEQAGLERDDARLCKAVQWLATSQDKKEGSWPAFSLNKNRNPSTEIGHFMTDAATAYSVLALENSR